jgi:hypothetical protein
MYASDSRVTVGGSIVAVGRQWQGRERARDPYQYWSYLSENVWNIENRSGCFRGAAKY